MNPISTIPKRIQQQQQPARSPAHQKQGQNPSASTNAASTTAAAATQPSSSAAAAATAMSSSNHTTGNASVGSHSTQEPRQGDPRGKDRQKDKAYNYDFHICFAAADDTDTEFALQLTLMLSACGANCFFYDNALPDEKSQEEKDQLIIRAASTSRVGVVLASEGLFSSPSHHLAEIRALYDNCSSVVPVFFKMKPAELKKQKYGDVAKLLLGDRAHPEKKLSRDDYSSFNHLLVQGVVPTLLQLANIAPVFKDCSQLHSFISYTLSQLKELTRRHAGVTSPTIMRSAPTQQQQQQQQQSSQPSDRKSYKRYLGLCVGNLRQNSSLPRFVNMVSERVNDYQLFAQAMLDDSRLPTSPIMAAGSGSSAAIPAFSAPPPAAAAVAPSPSPPTVSDASGPASPPPASTRSLGLKTDRDNNKDVPEAKKEYMVAITNVKFGIARTNVDLEVNTTRLANFAKGDVLEITQSHYDRDGAEDKSQPSTRIILEVQSTSAVRSSQVAMGISQSIIDQYKFTSSQPVTVRLLRPNQITLNLVELSFGKNYISRSELWRIKQALCNSVVYCGKEYEGLGVTFKIGQLRLPQTTRDVNSGYIGPSTKFIFRSKSARIYWLIQLSSEMWEYADDGELYFEKVLAFVKILLKKWSDEKVTHNHAIIFFSRTLMYDQGGVEHSKVPSDRANALTVAKDKLFWYDQPHLFQDHYKVVMEHIWEDRSMNTTSQTVLNKLRAGFHQYHSLLKWGSVDPDTGLKRVPASAADGNLLEAMNLCLSLYNKHHIDRDVLRTGQNIVVMSAGNGFFRVDRQLSRITKQRMVDLGIAADLVSVARPPLHPVPLFQYRNSNLNFAGKTVRIDLVTTTYTLFTVLGEKSDNEEKQQDPEHDGIQLKNGQNRVPNYYIPHWLQFVFYDYQDYLQSPFGKPKLGKAAEEPVAPKPFVPVPWSRMFDPSELDGGPATDQLRSLARRYKPVAGDPNREKQLVLPEANDAALRDWMDQWDKELMTTKEKEQPKSGLPTRSPALGPMVGGLRHNTSNPYLSGMHPPLTPSHGPGSPSVTHIRRSLSDSRTPELNPAPSAHSILGSMQRPASPTSTNRPASPSLLTNSLRDREREARESGTRSPTHSRPLPESPQTNGSSSGHGARPPPTPPTTFSNQSPNISIAVGAAASSANATTVGNALMSPTTRPVMMSSRSTSNSHRSSSPTHGRGFGGSSSHAQSIPASTRDRSRQSRIPRDRPGDLEGEDSEEGQAPAATNGPARSRDGNQPPSPQMHTSNSSSSLVHLELASSTQEFLRPATVVHIEKPPPHMDSNQGSTKLWDSTIPPQDVVVSQVRAFSHSSQGSQDIPVAAPLPSHRSTGSTGDRASTPIMMGNNSTAVTPSNSERPPATPSPFTDASVIRTLSPLSSSSVTLSFPPPLASSSLSSATVVVPRNGIFLPPPEPEQAISIKSDTHAKIRAKSVIEFRPAERTPVYVMTETVIFEGINSIVQTTTRNRKKEKEQQARELNPFISKLDMPSFNTNKRRWEHLLDYVPPPPHNFPNWKSLVSPAILPLTTAYFPTPVELGLQFTENLYQLSLDDSATAINVLNEMIFQRLAQEYQVNTAQISGSGVVESSSQPFHVPHNEKTTFRLSAVNQFHQIDFDAAERTIGVKRYIANKQEGNEKGGGGAQQSSTKNRTVAKDEVRPYRYWLWSDEVNEFIMMDRDISPSDGGIFEFQYWNQVDQLISEPPDPQGCLSFFDYKQKCVRYALIPKEDAIAAAIAGSASDRFQRLCEEVKAILAPLNISVPIVPSAMSQRTPPPTEFLNKETEEARKDEDMKQYQPGFGGVGGKRMQAITVPLQKKSSAPPANTSPLNVSERSEWLEVRFDKEFDPTRCYHVEIHWLVAAGKSVYDFIESAIKKVVKSTRSFIWVQIPITPPSSSFNYRTSDAFHPIIHLSVPAQMLGMVQDYLLQSGYARDSDDSRWRRQYLHSTGCALIRVVSDGLLWTWNYLPANTEAKASQEQREKLFRDLRDYCARVRLAHSIITQCITTALSQVKK